MQPRCVITAQAGKFMILFSRKQVYNGIRLIITQNLKNMLSTSVKSTELTCHAENKIFDFARVISFRFYRKARSRAFAVSVALSFSRQKGRPASSWRFFSFFFNNSTNYKRSEIFRISSYNPAKITYIHKVKSSREYLCREQNQAGAMFFLIQRQ